MTYTKKPKLSKDTPNRQKWDYLDYVDDSIKRKMNKKKDFEKTYITK